jgi:NAD(P)-dependent dehydrogenase (short-subunit alcohol dehydrogenase family)
MALRTRWTTADIPHQTGRAAVVTGANSGIGYSTAMHLASKGARVVLACRDEGRGRAALERLRTDAPAADAELSLLDLADLASVREFAARLLAEGRPLDILVNNAGVMGVPVRKTTADGFELQFGTNHLGHFALTGLLLPAFVDRAGARVVTVSSLNHWAGRMRFDDLHGERGYRAYSAYSASKLSNVLFFRELDRRLRARGSPAISVGAHPGYSATNLQQAGPRLGRVPVTARALTVVTRVVGQSDEAGAWPSLYAATAPGVEGGQYFGPSKLMETRGTPARARLAPWGRDQNAARRLWEASEEATGVTFGLQP